MQNFEIRDLRMVRMIVEAGNLTSAADRLNISQSALSRQLLDLEARLGDSLFIRQPRKMVLTDLGREILALADEILPKLNWVEMNLASRQRAGGELKLGVQCRSCFVWIPQVLSSFHERFPQVSVSIIGTDDYVRDFDQNRIELVITHEHHDVVRKGFVYDHLYTDEMVFFMAVDHPMAAKPLLKLSDFSQVDYFSAVDKAVDPFYHFFLRPAGIEPRSFTTITQGQSLMTFASAGHGLAILPRFVVKEMVDSGKLTTAAVEGVSPVASRWFITYRENQELSETAQAFIGMVREFMQDYLRR